jgi:predicted regulator of Ras-like GTPase activity (Roadblock/LC7/MglB family)
MTNVTDPSTPAASAAAEGASQFDWLLTNFVNRTTGVLDALGVSSDGLLMASSSGLSRAAAEKMSAIVSGLVSLGRGSARCVGANSLEQVIVEFDRGFLFVSSISDGSALGTLARRDCDMGLIGYEITLLVERAGTLLTPEIVTELKRRVIQ